MRQCLGGLHAFALSWPMPIATREARQLAGASEWSLIESSLTDRVRELPPARLKSKIARARTLRNKYRDLAKRQHRKAQPRRSGRPDEALNARTKRKVQLFEEVLARLEKERDRRGAKKPSRPKKPARPRSAPRTVTRVRKQAASPAPKSAASRRSGQHRIHAHVSSAGRRRQSHRDRRGR